MPQRLVIDASHGNSGKDHIRQAAVVREIAAQIAAGERESPGVMLESNIVAGRQEPGLERPWCTGRASPMRVSAGKIRPSS